MFFTSSRENLLAGAISFILLLAWFLETSFVQKLRLPSLNPIHIPVILPPQMGFR